ncbi:MAG: hypothetical protein U7127_13520 [Phormidium sp.]
MHNFSRSLTDFFSILSYNRFPVKLTSRNKTCYLICIRNEYDLARYKPSGRWQGAAQVVK